MCCHLTCQHCGEKICCGIVLNQFAAKDKYRQIQTNPYMLWINLKTDRETFFSSHKAGKNDKAAFAVTLSLTMLHSQWGAGTASHASIFTGFNTSVPCHIPEHIQISPWHFTQGCALLYNVAILTRPCTQCKSVCKHAIVVLITEQWKWNYPPHFSIEKNYTLSTYTSKSYSFSNI